MGHLSRDCHQQKREKGFCFACGETGHLFPTCPKKGRPQITCVQDRPLQEDDTELHCDANSIGFGEILIQRKSDLKFHPVFYFSKRTTEVESRYHSFELEVLAIIYALRRFRIYLQGIKFKILMDCNSLRMTLNKREINPRIARWALELQNFNYEVEHRPGARMAHADALSRATNILVVEGNSFELNLALLQNRDPEISKIRDKLEKQEDGFFEMRNGLVYV
ncbi:Transposon Tf2-9 polyprotein [Anthophora retusa]